MTRQREIRRAELRPELRLKIFLMIGSALSVESERNTSRKPHRGVYSKGLTKSISQAPFSCFSVRSTLTCDLKMCVYIDGSNSELILARVEVDRSSRTAMGN